MSQEERTRRARLALERGEMTVTPAGDQTWSVRNGDSDPYTVTRLPEWACTCPDFTKTCLKHGWRCKHIDAVRLQHPDEENTMTPSPQATNQETASDALRNLIARLKAPFSASMVSWKPQTISKDKTRAMAVAYVDARDVMDRLDEVAGPFNWQVEHREAAGQLITGLGLRHPASGEWLWKWDVGFVGGSDSDNDDTQMKAVKGTASDGLKRAAVLWGVARYLYSLPKQWVDWDADKRQFKQQPVLPNWALPGADRKQPGLPAGGTPAVAPAGNGAAPGQNGSGTPPTGPGPATPAGQPKPGPVGPQAVPQTVEDARAVVCTLGASDRPDFRGQTFGQLSGTPEGRAFIARLARQWTPDAARPDGRALKKAAQLLAPRVH